MTDRTMRPALFLVALAVLAGSSASRAEAQAISSSLTVSIDGKKLKNGSNVYINRKQCNEGTWKLDLIGYSVTVPYLELWSANNQTTNCGDATNRTSGVNGTQTICWGPHRTANQVNGKVSFELKGSELFSRDGGVCDAVKGTKFKIQFVTLDSYTQGGTATVSASNNNPNQVSAIFTLYTAVPDPPTNIKPRSGGRTLGVSWDKINNDPLTQYRAFFDHDPNAPVVDPSADAGVPTVCGTGAFFASGRADDGGVGPLTGDDLNLDASTLSLSDRSKGSNISITDLDSKGIAINTYTQVAVAAIDGAGNVGALSTPVCVLRADTVGYLDTCKNPDGGPGNNCGELDTCSLSPRNTGSAFWLSACTLALSAWARRRRRNV